MHFWDAAGSLGPLFKDLLSLPGRVRAWDLYLLYPPGPRWELGPPLPAYWQHQLGDPVLTLAPKLDAGALLRKVRGL